MKFEVLTGEDAEKARNAGEKLQVFDVYDAKWDDRPNDLGPCDDDDGTLYRIKPQPKTRRVPLPDLRVLAGAMIVNEDGDLLAINRIRHHGTQIHLNDGYVYTGAGLALGGFHYVLNGETKSCWTEEEVEG